MVSSDFKISSVLWWGSLFKLFGLTTGISRLTTSQSWGCSRTPRQSGRCWGYTQGSLYKNNSKLPLKVIHLHMLFPLWWSFDSAEEMNLALSVSSCPSNKSTAGSILSVSAHVALCLYISYIYTYCDQINRLETNKFFSYYLWQMFLLFVAVFHGNAIFVCL